MSDTRDAAATFDGREVRSYHGQAVIKEPVWTWEIPCYFFTGGLAGASAGLAWLCDVRGNVVLARRAWTVALGAVAISPGLLISDLGKPTRFINMLRMFKITSPMSVGSWVLVASGGTTTVAAANAWTGRFQRSARMARPAAALLGLPLSTYTAALVSNTAVPVWHEARRTLPYVFASGAALSAGAVTTAVTSPRHAAPARRLALAGAVYELAAKELMERRLGELGEPYRQGTPSTLGRLARGLISTGGMLLATKGRTSRVTASLAGTLLAAGALSARWSIFRAGFKSASDPRYVVGPQRERVSRGAGHGASRSEARIGSPDRRLGSPATVT